MTLIRLCAAQIEVVGDGERKGMKEGREEVLRVSVEADKMSQHPLCRGYHAGPVCHKTHRFID